MVLTRRPTGTGSEVKACGDINTSFSGRLAANVTTQILQTRSTSIVLLAAPQEVVEQVPGQRVLQRPEVPQSRYEGLHEGLGLTPEEELSRREEEPSFKVAQPEDLPLLAHPATGGSPGLGHGVKHAPIILHRHITGSLAADSLLKVPPDVLTVVSAW